MARKTNMYMKEELNKLLRESNQIVRIIKYTGTEIILSNGLELRGNRRICFGRRIKQEHWISHFDKIYLESNSEIENKIKKELCSKGGVAVQKKYGDKIKKNLAQLGNVPWNKGTIGIMPAPWNKGLTYKDDPRIEAFRKIGKNNPMFGVKQTIEQRQHKSKLMKEKIASGEFTPNVHNSRTHWQTIFKGKRYRSSWEALFQYFNKDYDYETVRIKYSFNGETRIYIVDFVNHIKRHLVEIKPKSQRSGAKTLAKEQAAKQWCKQHNYKYDIITEDGLASKQVTDYSCFDSETRKRIERLYEINKKNRN